MRSKEQSAFYLHKSGAERDRGIQFKFTFEQWCAWWEDNLGPDWFQLRGCRKDKYVMARKGDKGPYALWNVKCITHSENSREQHNNKGKRLTEAQVIEIYMSDRSKTVLSAQFKVSKDTIKLIRNKKTWSTVTNQLTYTGVRGSVRK